MRVVFCLPGNRFSGSFLDCWSGLLTYCPGAGITPRLSRCQSCNIYYLRNLCLGGDVTAGKHQKPFGGNVEYDYVMWIDSDILFRPEQFKRLLDHDKDIISGLYRMEGGKLYATCKDWDEEYFRKHGQFKFLAPEEVQGQQDLIDVSYTGMGFMLIKRGVFESMEYPWFRPIFKEIGDAYDFTMEDVAFCLQARELGYNIWVDPQVIVGHEKTAVL